jgi:type II secretory pathway predicted ATPase ExeA
MEITPPQEASRAGGRHVRLTPTQEAAVARVGCGMTDRSGSAARGPVVLLCGPAGVGTTTVLHALAAGLAATCSTDIRTAADWITALDTRGLALPDVVIADNAHESSSRDILRLITAIRDQRRQMGLVLAGEGRLLSVVARDVRLERAVGMRATLRPLTATETRAIVAECLANSDPPGEVGQHDPLAEAARSIHEIAAGMPGAVVRITGQAAIVADSRPDRQLTAADIELVHRRLSLTAA